MESNLKKAILEKDQAEIKKIIGDLDLSANWSLISYLEELSPEMLMEAKLKYKNFHLIKMSLFLREFCIKKYFSKKTEKQLLEALALNLSTSNFSNIQAGEVKYTGYEINQETIKKMVEEIYMGNSHNAYYYALGLKEKNPELLCDLLLQIGAYSIPDTLGHIVSCFYPVLKDYVYQDSPFCNSALLSYIMYLGRYSLTEKQKQKINNYIKTEDKNNINTDFSPDYNDLLQKAASGEGIINLHHMITAGIFVLWENDKFTYNPPYELLPDWMGEKEIDKTQKNKLENINLNISLPDNYQEFNDFFSFSNLEQSIPNYLALLENNPEKALDWLFRIYTENLATSWDPHYFTSIYVAYALFSRKNIAQINGYMAFSQTIKYFAASL
ncbi:MAG: hypothetical protein ACOC1S_00070 [bacterium]